MSPIGLADVKPLVSLSEGDEGHDDLLTGFISGAAAKFKSYLRRDLDVDFPDGWPEDLLLALSLQVADLYEQQFGDADPRDGDMHPAVKGMLAPYRNFGG